MMENLVIEGTKKTPEIQFLSDGKLKISGRSIPEDPSKFYNTLLLWIYDYCNNLSPTTIVDIDLEYFNSGSSKYILQVLRELKVAADKGNEIKINWYYEEGDDDILERGEYYASILEIDINFIEVK
ncbi:MAG: DUF1987 domain-containing protein [Bacteroidales bacterium]|nr:DUF1987 domain-containing protein [Bacteroidales bacterium]